MMVLRDLEGLIIIDEVQRSPGLFEVLRVLVDRTGSPSRFLILGSVSPELLRQSSETLAGRIAYVSTLIVKQLLPWHENISKRQVKAPKVYVKDSGLLHALLNLPTMHDLEGHPKVGASWEGFVLAELILRLGAHTHECFFWATHGGAELDLLVVRGLKRYGFEIKRTRAPQVTPSMRQALADLKLKRLDVIHAGDDTFPMSKKIRAVAFSRILEDIRPL